MVVAATENEKVEASSGLRPERKSKFWLWEHVCRPSKLRDLISDLFAGTFPKAAACFTVSRH